MVEHQIANYQPSDQEDLIQFFRTVFAAIGFDFDLNSKDKDLQDIPSIYQAKGGLFLLARLADKVDRRGRTSPNHRRPLRVDSILRATVYHAVGSGPAFSQVRLHHAKACRSNCIRLDTTARLASAISLFERTGFSETRRHTDDRFAEIFMELRTN